MLVVLAAIAIPVPSCCGQRASNERNAMTSLKTLTSAEADLRLNDRDGNHVNDFWTAALAGDLSVGKGPEEVYAQDTKGPWRQGAETPPGIRTLAPAYLHWPDDPALKACWKKLD